MGSTASNSLNKKIGSRIRLRREAMGYTREQLAEWMDISYMFLCQIEQGRRGISLITLQHFCKILHITADYIIFGEPESHSCSTILDSLRYIEPDYVTLAEEWVSLFYKTLQSTPHQKNT